MRKRLFVLAVCAATIVACTSVRKPAPVPAPQVASSVQEGRDRVEHSNLVTVTARVEAIDLSKRLVTLRGPQGNITKVQVDERVKNLPQVRKGDEVRVSYYESLAFQVRKPGEAEVGTSMDAGLETAKLGEKPGGLGAQVVQVTTTVEAIDKAKGTVTLKGPSGQSEVIKARNPANLDKVKVGDLVEITYTQALAVAVEKPQK